MMFVICGLFKWCGYGVVMVWLWCGYGVVMVCGWCADGVRNLAAPAYAIGEYGCWMTPGTG